MVLIVTAKCSTDSCSEKDLPNVFEQEPGFDLKVFCGKCKNEITNITVVERQ
jgi:hypothetical protein